MRKEGSREIGRMIDREKEGERQSDRWREVK